MLDDLRAYLAARGVALGLAELHADVRSLLDRAGLLAAIGSDMLFDNLEEACMPLRPVKEKEHEQEQQKSEAGRGDNPVEPG
jgi:hypothetical protein